MTSRTAQHLPLRRRLALSTALAGPLLVWHGGLAAQSTPVAPSVQVGAGIVFTDGGAPVLPAAVNGSATNLGVQLGNNAASVINWQSFDIAAGATVDFNSTLGTSPAAVLNRVTGPSVSTINGALTSSPNVAVWLINGNGILVGATGAISTGSFVGSTLGVTDADFISGDSYSLSASANSTSAITIAAGATITTGAGNRGLILVAPRVRSEGVLNAGTGEVAFVTASEANLNFTPGSPLAITLARGTRVGGDSQYVRGTVAGRNVYFALASQSAVTDALLDVDAAVTATTATATDRGIVLSAGSLVGGVNPVGDSAGAVDVRLAGSLTASGPGGRIVVAASDTIASNATLTASGGITLNAVRDLTQTGAITGASLIAGGSTVALGGGTLAGSATVSASGAVSQSGVLRAGGDIAINGNGVTLADVASTGGATSVNAGNGTLIADAVGAANTLLLRGASVDVGSATSSAGSLDAVSTGGDLAIDSGSAAIDARIVSARDLLLGGVSAGRDLTVTGRNLSGTTAETRANLAAGRDLSVTVTGGALLGAASAGRDAFIDAVSIDASTVSATTGVASVRATGGDARVGDIIALGTAAVTAVNGVATVSGNVTVGGNYIVSAREVVLGADADAEVQQANGSVDITATAGAIAGGTGLTLRSDANGFGGERLILDAATAITLPGSRLEAGASGGSDLGIRASTGQAIVLGDVLARNLGTVDAARTTVTTPLVRNASFTAGDVTVDALAIQLSAGDLALGDVVARAGGVTLTTDAGGITAGDITATAGTSAISLTAATGIAGGVLRAAGAVTVDGSTVDLDGADAGGDVVIEARDGTLAAGTVNADGAVTLTALGAAGEVRVDAATAGTGDLLIDAAGMIAGDTLEEASLASGRDIIANAGGQALIGALSAGNDATVIAGGLVSLRGNSSIGRDLYIEGAAIELNPANASRGLSAGRSAELNALAGAITGTNGLQIIVGGGVTDGTLLLRASEGIDLPADFINVNGPAGTFGFSAGAGRSIRFGNVNAAIIGTVDAAGVVTQPITHDGDLTFGRVTTNDFLVNLSAGDLTTGFIDAAGRIELITAAGDVSFQGGEAVAGDVVVDAAGALTVTSNLFGEAVTLTAGSMALSNVQARSGDIVATAVTGDIAATSFVADAGAATLATTPAGGDILADLVRADGDVTLRSNGAVAGLGAAGARLTSTSGAVDVIAAGAVTLADVDAATDITIVGGSITSPNSFITPGQLTLQATAGGLSLNVADGGAGVSITGRDDVAVNVARSDGGSIALTSTAGGVSLVSASAIGDITVDAAAAASVAGNVTAGANYTVTGGSVALGVDDDAEVQQADGGVTIVTTAGLATGGPGLVLRSNDVGPAGDGITFRLADGIDFYGDEGDDVSQTSRIEAAGLGELVRFELADAGAPITLGDVVALGITSNVAGAEYATGLGGLSGPVRTGTIAVANDLSIVTTGSISTRDISSGGALTLVAGGALRVAGTTSAGDALSLTGASITLTDAASARSAQLLATGAATGTTIVGSPGTELEFAL